MSRGLNKVQIIGNIAEPEFRTLPGGDSVATIRAATTESWKDKQTGDKKEATEWHNIILYKQKADFARQYAKKGMQIYAEGKLRTRKWTDKEGVDRYTTEIIAEEFQLLGNRPAGAPAAGTAPQDAHQETRVPEAAAAGGPSADDDLPF